ncbi:unannotated protein [freshwater metagenome]|uniref:Unannotated protein n=1 Tax=freshwater metagenome TaxID=449393 RepID=A0A6J7KXK1_9ZZZZ
MPGNWTLEPTCGIFATTDTAFATPLTGTLAAGSYVTHCTGGTSTGYNPTSYVNGSFAVNKASSTTTVTCPSSVTYTGTPRTPCSASVTGAGGLSLTPTPTYANNTAVGTNTASASYTYGGDTNHDGSSDSKSFSISGGSSATIYIVPTPKTVRYGASKPKYTYTLRSGSPTGPQVRLNFPRGSKAPKCTSSYAVRTPVAASPLMITCSGGSLAGYSFDTTSTAALTIVKATSTTTVVCPTVVYYTGSALTPCSAYVRGSGGLQASVAVTYQSNVAVGRATARATYAGDANHLGSSGYGYFTIRSR